MAINDNFYQPPPPKIEEEVPQECKDRAYWHKRFNFASWLFLIFGFWAIFASETPWSALIALAASVGFRIADAICDTRHMIWHWRRQGDDCDIR